MSHMSGDRLTRRQMLAAAALSVGSPAGLLKPNSGGILATDQPVAWAPVTSCGLNLGYGWNPPWLPVAGQAAAFRAAGISFVRGIYPLPFLGPWLPAQVDAMVSAVTAAAPHAGDNTKIDLTCPTYAYAVSPGDTVVLSLPVTVGSVTLPAQTPLTVTASVAGTLTGATGQMATPATVTVAAGGSVFGSGSVPGGAQIFHANFFKFGSTPRNPIPAYVAMANAWLAAGIGFDHGALHENWASVFALFGQANVQPVRVQEWVFFAAQGWPPGQVLISDENEPYWPGATFRDSWESFRPYFQNTLYPGMRAAFPRHTLAFGNPAGCVVGATGVMDWWPADPNTVLRIHGYPLDEGNGNDGEADLNSNSPVQTAAFFAWAAATARRIGVPRVHLQEFGLVAGDANRSTRLQTLRQAAQALGWTASVWCLSSTGMAVMQQNAAGLWVPRADAAGAFGVAAAATGGAVPLDQFVLDTNSLG